MGSNNQPRTFKFYRKNEEEVMKALGIRPTKNSGSGWIEKEDGQNDYVICQLKSTDAQSIKVNQKDIRILEKNARVAHKVPLFAIQFLNTGEVFLMIKPEDISDVVNYINTGECDKRENLIEEDDIEEMKPKKTKKIKSSSSAREKFHEDRKNMFKKNRSAL